MIINGGYGLLAANIGEPVAQADWLGPKVGGHLALFLYSSHEPSELSQWLCCDDSTINIVMVIIIIIFIIVSEICCMVCAFSWSASQRMSQHIIVWLNNQAAR